MSSPTPSDRGHRHDHGRPKHPYWKRFHKDWKTWVVVVLMLGAMVIYLTSNDLSVQPAAPAGSPAQKQVP